MKFKRNSGITVGEMIIVLLLLIALAAVLLPALLRSNEAARRASCQNNLKQFGLVYKMYANESRHEMFPAMSLRGFEKSDGGLHMTFNFGPHFDAIYPEYLTDPNILRCPTDPNASIDYFVSEGGVVLSEWRSPEEGGPLTLNGLPCTDPRACIHAVDNSYWYWGYVFDKLDEAHGLAPVDALSRGMAAHGVQPRSGNGPTQLVQTFEGILLERALPALAAEDLEALNLAADADVPVALGNAKVEKVQRIREGIERMLVTDIGNPDASPMAQAQIAVMFDAMGVSALDEGVIMFNHMPRGGNVLYMDGHVAFVRFEEHPPVTNAVAEFAAAVLRQ